MRTLLLTVPWGSLSWVLGLFSFPCELLPGTSVITSGKQDLLTTPVALPHLKMMQLVKL